MSRILLNSSSNHNHNRRHNTNHQNNNNNNKIHTMVMLQWKTTCLAIVAVLSLTNLAFLGPRGIHNNVQDDLDDENDIIIGTASAWMGSSSSSSSSSSRLIGATVASSFDIDTRNTLRRKQEQQQAEEEDDEEVRGTTSSESESRLLFTDEDLTPIPPKEEYVHSDINNLGTPNESFGACLKIMDDNHWLVEWLAYHWFVLPLRHLVVYVDPESQTSPYEILERWNSKYMNIQIIQKQYHAAMPAGSNPNIPGILDHRGPHSMFVQDCMKILKKQNRVNWIIITDTDEFVAINDWMRGPTASASYNTTKQSKHAIYRGDPQTCIPKQNQPGSVMRLLQQENHRIERLHMNISYPHCRPMHRLQLCSEGESNGNLNKDHVKIEGAARELFTTTTTKDGDKHQQEEQEKTQTAAVSSSVPPMITPSDFLTQRIQYGDKGRQVKQMINLSGFSLSYLTKELDLLKDGNVHNPVPGFCPKLSSSGWELGPYLPREQALFQVYHYTGTLEQREFRNDRRGKFGTRVGTPVAEGCNKIPATDVASWLSGFVDLVGIDEAHRLLNGTGRTDGWPINPEVMKKQERLAAWKQQYRQREIVPTDNKRSSNNKKKIRTFSLDSKGKNEKKNQPSQKDIGFEQNKGQNSVTKSSDQTSEEHDDQEPRCAIALYGLARSFQRLVLPSVIENVIKPNAQYNCDYFVHYYHQRNESAGRSGSGGEMNPYEVLLLRQHVLKAAKEANFTHMPEVTFHKQNEEKFWKQYSGLINKVRNEKDGRGRLLYFPWREKSYIYPVTTDNIIKMWHSIQEAFNMLTDYSHQHNYEYKRVAMLRVDVVYMTPIDIYDVGHGKPKDFDNKFAVIPGFGKYPISDRMIYGPKDAVQVWATERFDRMEKHVKWIANSKHSGYGLHSERFVQNALFPNILNLGVNIIEHDTLCFFRARSDGSVWISDCGEKELQDPTAYDPHILENLGTDIKGALERITGQSCDEPAQVKDLRAVSINCDERRRKKLRYRD